MIQKTSAAKASFSRLAPGSRQWPKTIPGQANKWRPFGQHTDANAHHLQLGKTRAVKRQNIRAQSDLNCQRGRKHCQWQVGFSGWQGAKGASGQNWNHGDTRLLVASNLLMSRPKQPARRTPLRSRSRSRSLWPGLMWLVNPGQNGRTGSGVC